MKIILLGRDRMSTHLIYETIHPVFPVHTVILEQPVSKKNLLKKRIKRLGMTKVIGQILFQLFLVPLLKKEAKNRILEIIANEKWEMSLIPNDKVKKVNSINDEKVIDLLKKEQPTVVIVAGTRIINKEVLSSVRAQFINIHSGITPRYRGSHGGYWALAQEDQQNCGVTLHFIDQGIDTGNIIAQSKIKVTDKDNFVTYPYLQIAQGIKLLKKYLSGNKNMEVSNVLFETGKVYYHPTVISYLKLRLKKQVK